MYFYGIPEPLTFINLSIIISDVMKKFLLIVALLALLTSCGSVREVRYVDGSAVVVSPPYYMGYYHTPPPPPPSRMYVAPPPPPNRHVAPPPPPSRRHTTPPPPPKRRHRRR